MRCAFTGYRQARTALAATDKPNPELTFPLGHSPYTPQEAEMGCGCAGSKYVPPERAAARAGRREAQVVTDPNHPGNFWNGPQPRQEPVPAPAPKEQ